MRPCTLAPGIKSGSRLSTDRKLVLPQPEGLVGVVMQLLMYLYKHVVLNIPNKKATFALSGFFIGYFLLTLLSRQVILLKTKDIGLRGIL